MTRLIQIPALGCHSGLYNTYADLLPQGIHPQTVTATKDRLADCVAEILAAAPAKFILLGTSFGGRVAMELAVAAPQRILGLIIIGSGAGPISDQAVGLHRGQRMRSPEFATVLDEMAKIIAHEPGPNGPATRAAFIAMSQQTGAATMARQSDALAHRGDLRGSLSEIACPALCLWGQYDQYVPAADGRHLAEMLQHGHYTEIANCGHFPTLEYPELTASIVTQWIESNRLIPHAP
jgi:pimeloyl-ACP methyl ester carboxylesterase